MRKMQVLDSHTGGEPTRVVLDGGPQLDGRSVADKLVELRTHHDDFRRSVVNEPRGSDVLVGALLVEPSDPNCVAGVIFFDNVKYIGMCGHGTIGIVASLHYLGKIEIGRHQIETPVGIVSVELHSSGLVSVENVASYRQVKNHAIDVPGYGKVRGDVAWGGNWFYLVESHALAMDAENIEALSAFAWQVRQSINAQGYPDVDHIVLLGPPQSPDAHSKNFVLCPGRAYDRSPCGTGTSARLACLAADSLLSEGETMVQESIIGSSFKGQYRWLDRVAGTILPTITGRAFVTGEATLLFDQHDPYCHGIA